MGLQFECDNCWSLIDLGYDSHRWHNLIRTCENCGQDGCVACISRSNEDGPVCDDCYAKLGVEDGEL